MALLVLVVVAVFALRQVEFAMTFHPVRIGAEQKLATPPGAEDVNFTTADGVRLHGWYFTSKSQSEITVIYFHGNGGNISNLDWLAQRLADRNLNVLLFDYRGYGQSEGSCAGEAELYLDGDAAVAFVVQQRHAKPKRIVLYGQSLGTTVAADLASRGSYGAVIIESGLSSASSVASVALPWLPRPLHVLARNRFDSAQKMAQVTTPVLIAHGDPDPVIPTDEGRKLFAAASGPKELLIVPGAGHSVFSTAGDDYLGKVEDFIRRNIR